MFLTNQLKTKESKMENVQGNNVHTTNTTNVHAVVANAINNLTKVEFKKDVGIVVIQYKNDFVGSNSVTLYNFGVVSHIKWEGEEFLQYDFKISDEEYATFYQAVVNSLL
jgi:hypothetical protein